MELGHERGLAKAWVSLAEIPWLRGQAEASEHALERGLAYARSSGDTRTEALALNSLVGVALTGPMPVKLAIERCNEVLEETSQLRQLAILRPVESSAQSRAEIQSIIVASMDQETTPAQLHAAEVTLKRLGLAPADFQLRPLMIRLLTEQVAGYYDPKRQQFHLADWIDVDGQRPIMAHELTHALQDQHFNLRRFEHWPRGDSDAELAAHALIEGDATLAMTLYITSNPLRALSFLKSLSGTEVAVQELNRAPRALRETLLFPYQEGLNWTQTVYRYGGWSNVSQAFTQLPQSTEQILHPEKYFVREPPVKVNLPDLNSVLRPGVWRRLDSDVNGEWGFYLILDQFLNSPAESKRAAAGWGGDHYEVFENRRGHIWQDHRVTRPNDRGG